jgi:DNA-binding MarR family transcriptional regulator
MENDWHIDAVIHAPQRLRICAILQRIDAIQFTTLRDILGMKDSSLSKHLSALANTEYIEIKKEVSPFRKDSRRTAWISLTKTGKKAFDNYLRTIDVMVSLDTTFLEQYRHTSSSV